MKKSDRTALVAIPIVIVLGYLVSLAGSQGGTTVAEYPVFALSVGLAFLIQWLVFIPAYLLQTEKFFDITGSITYVLVILVTLYFSGIDSRSMLLSALVIVWAVRLGSFLFGRIHKAGKDGRFDEIKPSFIRFLNVWTIQGLWVTFTASAALVAISTSNHKELDLFAIIGFLVWLIWFAIEAAADSQESLVSANPGDKGKFIQTCLSAHSRHPN